MMSLFFSLVPIAALLWYIRNILFWVGLWQDKEYRLDRLFVHFRETNQGRHLFISQLNIIKWLLVFLYAVAIFKDQFAQFYEIILGTVFIFEALLIIRDIYDHRIKRPGFTGKTILLLFFSMITVIILWVTFGLTGSFIWLLLIDRILPWIIALFVFFLAFPTEIYRDITINQARKKIQNRKNILVVAVSGSYGKTSTKEYIAQMLATKFNVVKTPGSNNTPIGIAKTILSRITDKTQIFVVEMGAYKRGELEELTKIVQPMISVTTAISDQHFSLYGSLKNVIESEYELIHALPENGLALFNGNSKYMKTLFERTKQERVLYEWFDKKPRKKFPIAAYNIKTTTEGIVFTILLDNEEFVCKSSLLGKHTVENILPAVYIADYKGFSKQEIIHAVSSLQPPPQTMVKKNLENGTIIIDDTFNSSPESVMTAMEYLSLYKKKKLFVLAPVTELGKEAKQRHYQIGRTASKTCDYLFLLNRNFSKEITQGIIESKGSCKLQFGRPKEITKIIKELVNKDDAIVFEGKEAKMVLNKILKEFSI